MPQFNGSYNSNKTNWSASRISTYRQCPLKYYYTYVKKWRCSKEPDTTEAKKGTCFHETVEKFHTGMEHEKLFQILEEKIKEYEVDTTKYDEHAAVERFFLFWNEFVAKKELVGFKTLQEGWVNGDISDVHFIGAIDLLIKKDPVFDLPDEMAQKLISDGKAELL